MEAGSYSHMTVQRNSNSYFPHFYTATEHFARRFDKEGRQLAFRGRTRQDAVAWQRKLRARLIRILGVDTMQLPRRPQPQLQGREDCGNYWREDWTVFTAPDVQATFYLLLPKNLRPRERRPAVLCPHGHSSGGRFSPAGRRDIEAIRKQIEVFNYDYAVQMVARGFITLAPDARGFGQRREQAMQSDKLNPDLFINGSCHLLALMGHPQGQTVAGMWAWDLMRLVDYLQTRPEVDPDRIGSAGLSGGGLQTLYFAALDQRVKAAVISGYFYGVKESLIRQASHCDCNNVSHLWKYADMGDIGGLIAPRALFIETGDQDPLNGASGLANVNSQVGYSRKVYRALGAGDQLAHHVFPGEHRWCGERAVPWLEEKLGLKG
jgi:dienelactone hydrolase